MDKRKRYSIQNRIMKIMLKVAVCNRECDERVKMIGKWETMKNGNNDFSGTDKLELIGSYGG